MTCYTPLKAYAPLSRLDGGRYVFDATKALNPDNPRSIPCGNCHGCRGDKAEEWAVRASHEAQMHHHNSFITLTYEDKHLPDDFSVTLREWQLFAKKLRKALPNKIRHFAVGEYGDKSFRPHYHALIFGYDFSPDRKHYKNTPDGPLWTSELLTSTWGKGHCTLGQVNYKTANYCTQYLFDKRGGDYAADRYIRQHPVTGDIVTCKPEFSAKSNQPGLGATWFNKYKTDCFPSDFLIVEGRHVNVPRFYQLKLSEKEQHRVKLNRLPTPLKPAHPERKWNKTPERLKVRATVHAERLKKRKSSL